MSTQAWFWERTAVWALIAANWPGALFATESPVYRIGFRHSPPYLSAGEGGRPGGLAVEAINEAARRLGMRLAWRESKLLNYEEMNARTIDLWPLGDPLDSHGYGVTEPWIRDTFHLISLQSNRERGRVAVNRIPRTMGLLAAHVRPKETTQTDGAGKALAAVCEGLADAAFINARFAQELILVRPPECERAALRIETVPEAEMPLGIMYQPESREAATRLRGAIETMVADGTMGNIFAKWSHAANNEVELASLLDRSQAGRAKYLRLSLFLGIGGTMIGIWAVTLHRMNRATLASSRAKSHFVALVSHELRTPLQGLQGTLDLMAKTRLDAAQQELLQTMDAGTQTLRRIVGDILSYSRIESDRMEIIPKAGRVRSVITEAAALVAAKAAEENVAVEVRYEAADKAVLLDSDRLLQVVINLLDNSIKFSGHGRATVTVRDAGSGEASQRLSIIVEDTGVGIEPEKIGGLFEAFRQADQGDARRFGGLGLGLSICKGVVEAMGGTIEIESAPKAGTKVTVTAAFPLAPEGREPGKAVTGAKRARVLIVDDIAMNRQILTRLLEKLGHEAITAEGGSDAVAKWRESRFDLVLMDCQMPNVDGYEATRIIRGEEAAKSLPRTKIFALTASAEASNRTRCLEAGMDHLLAKPVRLEDLERAISATDPN